MKIGFLLTVLSLSLLSSTVNADMSYKCYRYVDGKPTGGFTKVSASSNDEAVVKATYKYRNKLKLKTDYVKCK